MARLDHNRELILKIQDNLERLKGFNCGSIPENLREMIVEYEGRRFILSIREIVNPSEDIFDDMDKCL